jgi:Arc/MetJ-type ribon-helix-helix transcriptional regulator
LAGGEAEAKDYEEIVVKLAISNDYLRKLEQLIDIKRIFSSRAEAFRRSLELLFEKYEEVLREG